MIIKNNIYNQCHIGFYYINFVLNQILKILLINSVILNAIDDFKNSKLYSIDLNSAIFVGQCVNKFFPHFMRNWKLFKGNIATEYIEKIGNNIDIAMIDTAHFEPGEILDFLIILPFLKKKQL